MPDLRPQVNMGGPADGRTLKWTAIGCFIAAPFLCVWTTMLSIPEPPAEHVEKAALFDDLPRVDTLVVGDSRVEGIAGGPFRARGWHYFDFGLSGVSPEDMAMQLKYALLHAPIRRVAMGVSFEGMTAHYPFEFSRFHSTGPFAAEEVVDFATVDAGPRGDAKSGRGIRHFLRSDVLPLTAANERLRWLVARLTGGGLASFNADGSVNYRAIQNQIAVGDYDFDRQRDPNIYYGREDSDTRYLKTPELAPSAMRLYRKVFAALRAEKIACVVFETGRTAKYQALIDARPDLARLQAQWREFFRSEAHGGIKFLDASATRDDYRDEDFFDAVHFVGPTTQRLAQRLADELASIEAGGPKSSTKP